MTIKIDRRAVLAGVAASLVGMPGSLRAESGGQMTVTKTPTCGCCAAWVEIARDEGYEVEVIDTRNYVGMKHDHGVPEALWSCHSARIGGYVVEGHVPMEAIAKLLDERPAIDGIAVPGMPAGSPGMGDDPDARFDVMAFGGDAGDGAVFFRAGA